MSERYIRLFSLTENLYTEGAPVAIAAGTLLKDTQTGHILAQLKLRSISDKSIKAATVKLQPYDTAGRPLDDVITYQYLDLFVRRDVSFGQKSPLPFRSDIVRSYTAEVTEVIFFDNSLWQSENAEWKPLLEPVTLGEHFKDDELAQQYAMTYGNFCNFFPIKDRDLWICACGECNHGSEKLCHKCRSSFAALSGYDINALIEAKDKRLEAKRIAAEKAAAAAERAKVEAKIKAKKLIPVGVIGVVIVVIAAIVFSDIIKQVDAENEKARLENEFADKYAEAAADMNSGDYASAIKLFSELGTYKDSEAQLLKGKYKQTLQYMEERRYDKAVSLLQELDGGKDGGTELEAINQLIEETVYESALYYYYAGAEDLSILWWYNFGVFTSDTEEWTFSYDADTRTINVDVKVHEWTNDKLKDRENDPELSEAIARCCEFLDGESKDLQDGIKEAAAENELFQLITGFCSAYTAEGDLIYRSCGGVQYGESEYIH